MAPVEGFWGEPTATLDWCEENYTVTWYIAELWNTISNLVMIIPPVVLVNIYRKQNVEKQYIYCLLGLGLVFLGSWMFHMTLLYSMQLLDELPMIWSSCFLIYNLIQIPAAVKVHNRPLQIMLVIYSFIVTVVYLFNRNPIFHETAYAIMVLSMVFAGFRAIIYYKCSKNVFLVSLVSYIFGFLLWNIDHVYCSNLRYWRLQKLGILGPVTQLHAWWHLFAGFGTYLAIIFIIQSRYSYLKESPQLKCSSDHLESAEPPRIVVFHSLHDADAS